jgi:hypothetical protein
MPKSAMAPSPPPHREDGDGEHRPAEGRREWMMAGNAEKIWRAFQDFLHIPQKAFMPIGGLGQMFCYKNWP